MTLHWVLLFIAIAAGLAGQILLKSAAGGATLMAQFLDLRTLVGLAFYGGAAMLYIVALRRIPMSVALPCTAVSYVAAVLVGHYAFDEPIGAMHIAAISVIATGVVMLALA